MLVFGGLPSSCGGRVPAVDAVTALYPVVDPAGFFDNDDPALGGTARDMAGAYTGGSPRQFPQRYAAITSVTHISGARQHRPADLPPVDGAMAAIPRPGALSH